MPYKIYIENNYLAISENSKVVTIAKSDARYQEVNGVHKFWDKGNVSQVWSGLKSDFIDETGTAFATDAALRTFGTTNTSASASGGSGGGGGGDASASNQVIGNNKLTSIDNKTPALVGGKVPVEVVGSATETTQASNNTKLTSIDDKTSAQFVTNTGTLSGTGQTVALSLTSQSNGAIQISGTWVGTISFQATLDGTNFYPINAVSSTTSSPLPTTTVNGLYRLTPAGVLSFRVNMTSYTSGTANIVIRASNGMGGTFSNQVLPTIITSSATALAAGVKATMSAYGYQRVTLEPRVSFSESFDGSLLNTDRWSSIGTVVVNNGNVNVGNVLTTSTVHSITSKPSFSSLGVSFQVLAFVPSFETSPLATTNVDRFYGFGRHTGTPSLAVPVTSGVGFEWDNATGKLWGSVYQNGVRSASSLDLTPYVTSTPTRYAVLYRSDLVIFYIGSIEIPVGSISFQNPDQQNLPVLFQTVIGSTTPNVMPNSMVQAIAVGDTGGNATMVADADRPWIRQNIKEANEVATNLDKALVIRNAPIRKFRPSFAKAVASGADTDNFLTVRTGAGQTISQSGGNLLITSGTTVNSESIIRSNPMFRDSFILKFQVALSQRIINNNFFVELVDVIGDNLVASITSANSIVVTIPNNPFTIANVGQSMFIGGYNGTGVYVGGRYPIASVSGNNVTYTISGATAGTGTVSVFGWNYYNCTYNSINATLAIFDTQRDGYGSLPISSVISSTAPTLGHLGIITHEDGNSSFSDQVSTSSILQQSILRASKVLGVPSENTNLFLQIRSLNGSVAPSTTTTMTVNMVSVENHTPQTVNLSQVKNSGAINSLPVTFGNNSQFVTTSAASVINTQYSASLGAGALRFHLVSAGNTNATLIKSGQSKIIGWSIQNTTSTAKFVKLHNGATAPTAGVGVVQTIGIPANWRDNYTIDGGIFYSLGLGITTTNLGADADSTAILAGDLIIDIFYA